MATTAEPATIQVDPMVPRPMRILRRWAETDDTFTMELDPGPDGYPFVPGQFNMLYAFGVGEVAISISGDPTTPSTLIHTVRAVGAVTSALRDLEPGDSVGVRGPFGVGWPVDEAIGQDVVIIAGGIGLAPLRPAIYHVLGNRARYGQISVGIGFRSPAEMIFEEELREWRSRFDLEIE
ncbi:MAG: Ni/Fe hydrogenase subunit gamma, partial [Acidimicrobiia bacterium]|nr:Ni/Fe hydrogenase subunit gamma [Acidimicrobiia bacterium]